LATSLLGTGTTVTLHTAIGFAPWLAGRNHARGLCSLPANPTAAIAAASIIALHNTSTHTRNAPLRFYAFACTINASTAPNTAAVGLEFDAASNLFKGLARIFG